MKTEILIALLGNLKFAIGIPFVSIGVLLIVFFPLVLHSIDDEHCPATKLTVATLGSLFLGCLFLAVPSIDDLWRVRIGLLKFSLASPENVKAGAETLERIAGKLECKYLGCDEKAEK